MRLIQSIAAYNQHIGISPPKLNFLDCRAFGDNTDSVRSSLSSFRHNLYAIALLERGDYNRLHGSPEAGNVFLYRPFQIVNWNIERNWEGYYVIFDDYFFLHYLYPHGGYAELRCLRYESNWHLKLTTADTGLMVALFQRIITEIVPPGQDMRLLASLVHPLLYLVERSFDAQDGNGDPGRGSVAAGAISTFRQHILADMYRGFPSGRTTITAYAHRQGIGVSTLAKYTGSILDMSPGQYLNGLILSEAKYLLCNTDLQIQEVSDRLGYSNATHFNAFFRRHIGHSTTSWRRRQLTARENSSKSR